MNMVLNWFFSDWSSVRWSICIFMCRCGSFCCGSNRNRRKR